MKMKITKAGWTASNRLLLQPNPNIHIHSSVCVCVVYFLEGQPISFFFFFSFDSLSLSLSLSLCAKVWSYVYVGVEGSTCYCGNSGRGRIDTTNLLYNNNNNNNMPTPTVSLQQHPSQPISAAAKSMYNSSGLSLALETGMEGGQGDHFGGRRMGENNNSYYHESNNNIHDDHVMNINGGGRVRAREEETAAGGGETILMSRSGSDEGRGSGDDLDPPTRKNKKPKRYHRHTPQQIQELESLFKECPHPDEKQRLELSRRLSLETRQVKFWFQNRRTQMKTQLERHENSILRQENDKLRAENMSFKEAMRNPICSNCGSHALIGEVSLEEQHLRIENARLKDELDRVCALTGKFLGRGPSASSLDLGISSANTNNNNNNIMFGMGPIDFGPAQIPQLMPQPATAKGGVAPIERSLYLELALAAMDELVKMAQSDEPLWMRDGGRCVLNREEYSRSFSPCIGMKPNGFVTEASRESGVVIVNSLALVETLMESNKWAEMFPGIIARTTTTDVISDGMGGTRNGTLQLMHAELQVLSPLVPVREVSFLRFCKQHAEGVWAVVDVSIDTIRESSSSACRRLPSGCVVQDMPNGYSKVTWVEHAEYDETLVHQLYRPLIGSGMGFGARRWVAALQRQCECLAILMSSDHPPSRDHSAITSGGRRSMLKLAQRMTNNFCAGVCASTVHNWNKLRTENVDDLDVRVMTRKSVDDPGEPPGIVVSAATSVWLPVSPQRLFDFLRNEHLRSEWDILSNGGPMQEMAHIAKGQDHGNCVSLLRATAMNPNQSSMLILQETSTDAAGSLVVYAPVDIPAMHVVMNGGDSAYVALLPSGFAIVPDGPEGDGPDGKPQAHRVGGSLLTVVFQILVNSLPTDKLTVESVETVNNLISCTVQKIKAALQCES